MDKDIERRQFQKALSLVPNLKYLEVDIDGESPDFLIEVGGRITGVEITSLYRNLDCGNAAKTQSDLSKIAKDSVGFYNESKNQPLLFSFVFAGDKSINCKRKIFSEDLGNFLIKWKEERIGRINEEMEIDINNASSEIRKILRHVYITPIDSIDSLCIPYSGFKSIAVEPFRIKEAIIKKEKLIRNYKKRCDDIWLFIILPRMSMAADFYLNRNEIRIGNIFDKIYLFDEYCQNIIEIIDS